MDRAEILDTAKTYVTRDRAATHGDAERNFEIIATLWTAYLGECRIEAHDVAVMMTLLKVARIRSNPAHADNWIDGAGYLACGGEVALKGEKAPALLRESSAFCEHVWGAVLDSQGPHYQCAKCGKRDGFSALAEKETP